MKKREMERAARRLQELEEKIRRGELVEARACDQCQRGYTYCAPFDRWIPGECARGSRDMGKEK